ncbi:MAG: carboxypeptidase regulatory-like domain-containing protein [Proteobacteria bacterium]|nr:carboxypeptidase regulatory-like domain-containing protein [Pseudomonadota bacterium]
MYNKNFAVIDLLVVAVIAFFALRGHDTPSPVDHGKDRGRAQGAVPVVPASGADRDLRSAAFDLVVDDDEVGMFRLEGQVIDRDEVPVAGALVAISTTPRRTTLSQQDGSFFFDKLVGRPYTLLARKDSASAGPVTARLTATSDPVVLRLRPAASVQVTVLAADTRTPLAGANVQLRGFLTRTAATDSNGMAAITGVSAGFYRVAAAAPGYATAHSRLLVGSAGATYKIELVARKGAPVSGLVRDRNGIPIKGASVLYRSASEPFPSTHPRLDAVVTDADGRFAFAALPAGTFRFTAQHTSYAPGESDPVTLTGATGVDHIEIVVDTGAVLAGRVVTENGEPAAFAAVRVSTASGRRQWTRPRQVFAGPDGEFEITGLARAPTTLLALHERATSEIYQTDLSADPVQETIELVLALDGVIAGLVVDSSGEPVDGAQVRLRPGFRSRRLSLAELWLRGMSTQITDAGGRFEFRGLADRTYFVQAKPAGSEMRFRGFRGRTDAVEARLGDSHIRIVLRARGSIAGKVAFPDGSPVTMFSISTGGFRGGATPFVSKDGSFRLSDLEAGTYQPRLTGPDFDQARFPLTEVAAGQQVDVGTITVSRGRKLSGRVLSASGQPVAGATVLAGRSVRGTGASSAGPGLFGNPAPQRTATSDENGEFTLRGLGSTALVVIAEHITEGRSATLALPATTESATGLELQLLAPGAVAGTVFLDGQPADSVLVVAQSQSVASASFSVQTGSNGTYRFDVLAPDRYLISARVGNPRSGLATSSRATTVESGAVATVDLSIERGRVTVVVNPAGHGVGFAMVYAIEGVFAAANALELENRLANREAGFSSRSISFGGAPASIAKLLPARYTVCVVPFPAGVIGRDAFDYLGREAQGLAVFCKDAAVAASPEEQEMSIEVTVPEYVPDKEPQP